MENYLLYEDENQRVEILGSYHWYLHKEERIGDKRQQDQLLHFLKDKFSGRRIDLKKFRSKCGSKITILKYPNVICFNSDFDDMSEPFEALCMLGREFRDYGQERIDEFLRELESLYSSEDKKFYLDIFEEDQCGISGYIGVASNKTFTFITLKYEEAEYYGEQLEFL